MEKNQEITKWLVGKPLSDTIGKKVKIKLRTEVIEGKAAVGVNRDGVLIMKLEDGSLKNIIAGECIHLRNGGFKYDQRP